METLYRGTFITHLSQCLEKTKCIALWNYIAFKTKLNKHLFQLSKKIQSKKNKDKAD